MQSLFLLMLLLTAAPAAASGGVQIPEPSNMALFALGVLGVILGRMGAKRHESDDD